MKQFIVSFFILLGVVIVFSASCTMNVDKTYDQDLDVEPTYASLQTKVFTPKCVNCHSGGNAPHGVLCVSWEDMMNHAVFPPLIVPGNPEASSIYTEVRDGQMPKDGAKLSIRVVEAIYTWIKNGAKKSEDSPSPQPSPSPTEVGCSPDEPGCDDGPTHGEPCDLKLYPDEPGFLMCPN